MKIRDYYKEKDYIHYSNCHEDFLMLRPYLSLNDREILSVASGLDNSLAFLTNDNVHVDAFDFNPAQVCLCRLKKAAVSLLEYDEFLIFLGIKEGNPVQYYDKIRPTLDEDTMRYFDEHHYLISETKLVNAGKFEYYFRIFLTRVFPLVVSPKHISEFANVTDLDAQRYIYRKYVNTLRFRLMFRLFFSEAVMKRLGRDKAFFRYNKGSLSAQLKKRVDMGIENNTNGNNPYINYVLLNRYNTLPFYLEKQNFLKIKQNINHLDIHYKSFDDMLPGKKYDFMNLSDIFEYMPDDCMTAYSEKIALALNDYGKVAFWNMFNIRNLKLCRINSTEDLKKDRAYFYRDFLIYTKKYD